MRERRLPVGNYDFLVRVVRLCQESPADTDEIKVFFLVSLAPFFDNVVFSGLDPRVGHFLYRLSDFLSEERRRHFEIYPDLGDNTGELVVDGDKWYSLEDWRKMWERQNAPYSIPHISFVKKLEKRDLIFLLPACAKKD